jgi:hypothetical protein
MPFSSKASYLAQTTTVRVVKSTPGILSGYFIYNPNSSAAYVQFFDTAGTVTLGTTVPTLAFGFPATSAANILINEGITFANGIQLAVTTTATGNTAPSTGLDVNVFFQ